ncbi:MAG: SpoIIE family protein phosphatase [Lachnospiraceae bacterium]|nr:SpoIIE family protein phosphatase [Lachnospiraceae bacterium]
MRKKGIRKKVIIGLMFFALMIVVFTSILTCRRYYTIKMREYNELVYGYLRSASDIIDGDRIKDYVETDEPDEYYDTILNYLTAVQKETDLRLFYVFVPYEDDLEYVWQTDEDPYSWLGYHENYMEGGKETRDNCFRKDPVQEITFYHDPTYGNIACGFYPIFDSAGEPVALVGLDLSTPDLYRNILTFIITIVLIVIVATIIAGLIFFRVLSRSLVDPINTLNDAVNTVLSDIDNDEIPDISVKTGDELEELSDSFNKMHHDIRQYIKENAKISAEKGRIDAELSLAAKIQESALPSVFPPFPDMKEFDLFASMSPAKEVGGDFYDFFLVDDTHVAITVADVSGKGVPAAIFSMITMITIQNNAKLGFRPSEVLSRTNDSLCQNNSEEMFVTVWLGIMDITNGHVVAVNAGHELPAIRGENGMFELYHDEPHDLAIGFMEGAPYSEYEFDIPKGGAFFMYTDGVPESMREDSALFDLDRMIDALNKDPKAPIRDLFENVKSAIAEFIEGAEQFDDTTMLCVEYHGRD